MRLSAVLTLLVVSISLLHQSNFSLLLVDLICKHFQAISVISPPSVGPDLSDEEDTVGFAHFVVIS